MGKKIILIILSITLVIGLFVAIFLNNRIIKGDSGILGASHSLKISYFQGDNLENTGGTLTIVQHTGIARNGKVFNNYIVLDLFKIFNDNVEYNLIVYFNIPSDVANESDITSNIVYIDFGSSNWNTDYRVEVNSFVGNAVYLTNYINITRGSYFTFEISGYNLINLIDITSSSIAPYKPDFDHFANGYEIGDIAMLFADLFYLYPEWIILHISVPLRMFGGVFNW